MNTLKSLALLGATLLFIAMVVSLGNSQVDPEDTEAITRVDFPWTSDVSGEATLITSSPVTGKLISVVYTNGTGADTPTDNYDVMVNDQSGIDVLAGTGANIDSATNSFTTSALGAVAEDILTMRVAAAGATNSGTVTIFLE